MFGNGRILPKKNFDEAISKFEVAYGLAKKSGDVMLYLIHSIDLARAHFLNGDKDRALQLLNDAITESSSGQLVWVTGTTYKTMGGIYQSLGDKEKAVECFQKCIKIAQEVGDPDMEKEASVNLKSLQ